MKRSDAEYKINEWLDNADEVTGKTIIDFVTALGMHPPTLPEDHCQAIMSVYYAAFRFNLWEEDFDKNAQVVEALKRRLNRKK